MPERKGHGGSGHSRFDHMPTEELENILRLDFQLPEGEGLDADTLLYITEVIARREASSSQTSRPDVEAAWQDLLTRYLPDGTTDLLGDGAGSEPVLSPGQPSPAVRRHSRGIRWMIRIAGVAAILAVLFFVTTITAYALGYDVWGTIAKWSSETFSFAGKRGPWGHGGPAVQQSEVFFPPGGAGLFWHRGNDHAHMDPGKICFGVCRCFRKCWVNRI